MPKNNGLSIEDLEPSPELSDEELQQISGGTLVPDANGMVTVMRNGKPVSVLRNADGVILTPNDKGEVQA